MSLFLDDAYRRRTVKIGIYLLGLATTFAGILDLIWRDFDSGHQPINDLGFAIPGRQVLACLIGILMILAGAALLRRQTMRLGAWGMALIYGIVGMFSLPLFYSMTHKYGFHLTVILGVCGRLLQQFIVVAGCAIVAMYATEPLERSDTVLYAARWIFGLSGLLFGLAHLVNTKGVVPMIPGWFPFEARFWVILSGIAFMSAGAAILSGVLSNLAARLLVLMLLIFEVILVPLIFKRPHVHQAWGATAYNLTVAGAVLIFSVTIPKRGETLKDVSTH